MQGGHDPARFIPRGDAAVWAQQRAVLHHRTELPRPPLPSVRLRGAGGDGAVGCLAGSTKRVERLLILAPLTCCTEITRRAAKSGCKSVGAHRYAADPSTEVLCCAYAVDDEPVQLWTPGDPVPPEFIEAAINPSWIVAAHNDAFETAIEQHILAPRYGWPLIPLERHRCTMAMALAAGLPARLSAVADALELSNRKDAAGERLMHQMSKPRRAA